VVANAVSDKLLSTMVLAVALCVALELIELAPPLNSSPTTLELNCADVLNVLGFVAFAVELIFATVSNAALALLVACAVAPSSAVLVSSCETPCISPAAVTVVAKALRLAAPGLDTLLVVLVVNSLFALALA
jgi:hypothetical protein